MPLKKGGIVGWLVFAGLIILVFGLLVVFQKTRQPLPPSPPPAEEAEKTPGKKFATETLSPEQRVERDRDALNQALLVGGDCSAIEFNETLKKTCADTLLLNRALASRSEPLCASIENETVRQSCLDGIRSKLALENLDSRLCESVSDPALKQNCLDQLWAFFGRASADNCETISDPALKQTCADNAALTASVRQMDEQGCDAIQDPDLKARCAGTIQKAVTASSVAKTQAVRTFSTATQSLQNCERATGDEAALCRDEANYNLAFEKKDLSYCNAVSNPDRRSQCLSSQRAAINSFFLRQAVSTKDPSLCAKLLDDALRTSCLSAAQ